MVLSKGILKLLVTLLVATALAGCHDQAEQVDDPDGEAGNTDPTDGGDDDPVDRNMPPEKGSSLGAAERASLQALYDDQPLSDSQSPWPAHLLKWVSEDTFIGTHWNDDDPAQATELNWIVVGKKGVFCSEDRPGPESEWRHFHSYDAPGYPEGHGGEPGTEGYWLLHIAVRDFEAEWGAVSPGVDTKFMHTPAPSCGGDLQSHKDAADWGGEGGSSVAGTGWGAVYDDVPLSDSQSPWPAHELKWVSEETFIGTHWNNDDPSRATEMNWIVVGVRGSFCDDARPASAEHWRHFHSHDAPTYGEGHGGDPGEGGYWLLHAGVRDFEAPWGDVSPGVDTKFMHTPSPSC
ncbi:MAG: hypothetical protein KY455_06155 [Euryarchaeota archaeon]|nr:hypothetical protein [Euryarchaeota archaeon]